MMEVGVVEARETVRDTYRGPPPRKDLIPSPSKERDWKGNNWFYDMTENMNGSQNGVCEQKSNGTADVGSAVPGLTGEYVDPHMKPAREYESDYAKLALQGGHRGLLSMDCPDDAKIATYDEFCRRQRGCENISEYNKIALQGGHPDLLKIDDVSHDDSNGSPVKKNSSTRTCGDWYSDNNGVHGNVADNNNTSPKKTVKPTSPEPKTPPIRDQRRSHGNCIVPGGEEEPPKFGKKRFNTTSQRQEAPFATNY